MNQAASQQTTLMITHQLDALSDGQTLWVMEAGKLDWLPVHPAIINARVYKARAQPQRAVPGRPTAGYRLLLDEPAASLDALSERHVMQALNQAASQQTTLMITHNKCEGL
jgi:ABC-type transport system involved in cytochrome bd biosynthesis fused ATPase/permease subunit